MKLIGIKSDQRPEKRPLLAAYDAPRAASLAGVPRSTLYYWARVGIWVPTVSRSRQMRWSYSDLLAVRLIDWLRRDKPDLEIPHTSMGRIRYALVAVEELGEELGTERVMVWVDRGGGIVLRAGSETFVPVPALRDQRMLDVGQVDLVAAFSRPDIEAPDLAKPRPTLRIVPGKLASEPHVTHTRVSTRNLAALSRRGLSREAILALYPLSQLQQRRGSASPRGPTRTQPPPSRRLIAPSSFSTRTFRSRSLPASSAASSPSWTSGRGRRSILG